MDLCKIGGFLAELRRQNGLTQEQLGEKLEVSNKTVSRWETGTYLPPVEALQALSTLYGITINEILSGAHLEEAQYQKEAEENLKSALSSSAFGIPDRIAFFKKKWKREHILSWIAALVLCAVIFVVGYLYYNGLEAVALIGAFAVNIVQRNRMMAYVEHHVFGGSGKKHDKTY